MNSSSNNFIEGGLRLKGRFKKSPGKPVFSIITIVYNGEQILEETVQTVINQTYNNIEYIIIDGASKDGTLDIIRKYEDHIAYWRSEPDGGIYYAMNKGLKYATGDYVWFMNAGDLIESPDTLQKAVESAGNTYPDIYYGETNLIDETRKVLGTRSELTPRRLPEKLTWKTMGRGMVVSHQSIIVKREISPYYELKYFPCSSDIDWVIKVLKSAKNIHHTHLILSRYLVGGNSVEFRRRCIWLRALIYYEHYGLVGAIWNHILIGIRSFYYLIFHRESMKF